MPGTRVAIPNVAEADPGLWSNCIRAGDLLFIAGQVAHPFEGGRTLVGGNEYEQTRHIFARKRYLDTPPPFGYRSSPRKGFRPARLFLWPGRN